MAITVRLMARVYYAYTNMFVKRLHRCYSLSLFQTVDKNGPYCYLLRRQHIEPHFITSQTKIEKNTLYEKLKAVSFIFIQCDYCVKFFSRYARNSVFFLLFVWMVSLICQNDFSSLGKFIVASSTIWTSAFDFDASNVFSIFFFKQTSSNKKKQQRKSFMVFLFCTCLIVV